MLLLWDLLICPSLAEERWFYKSGIEWKIVVIKTTSTAYICMHAPNFVCILLKVNGLIQKNIENFSLKSPVGRCNMRTFLLFRFIPNGF